MRSNPRECALRFTLTRTETIGFLLAILWIAALAPRPAAATYEECMGVNTPDAIDDDTVAYWRMGENVNLAGVGGVSDQIGTTDGEYWREGQVDFQHPGRTHDGNFAKGFNLGEDCGVQNNEPVAHVRIYDPTPYATNPLLYNLANPATQLDRGTISFFIKPDEFVNINRQNDQPLNGTIISRYNENEMAAGYAGSHGIPLGSNEFGFEIILNYRYTEDPSNDPIQLAPDQIADRDPVIQVNFYHVDEFGIPGPVHEAQLQSDRIPREEWTFVAFSWQPTAPNLQLFVESTNNSDLIERVDNQNHAFGPDNTRFTLANNTMPMIFASSRQASPIGKFDNMISQTQMCGSLDEVAIQNWLPTVTEFDRKMKCIGGQKTYPGWFATNGAAQPNPGPEPPEVTSTPADLSWKAAILMHFDPPTDPVNEGGHITHHPAWPDPESGNGICNGACRIKGAHVRKNGNILLTYHSGEHFGTNPDAASQPRVRNHEIGEFNPTIVPLEAMWGPPGTMIQPGTTRKLLDECVWEGQGININAVSVHPERNTLLLSVESSNNKLGRIHCAGQNAINFTGPPSGGTLDWVDNFGDGDVVEYNGNAHAVVIPEWEARKTANFPIQTDDDDDLDPSSFGYPGDGTPAYELKPGGARLFFAGDSGDLEKEKFRKDENINAFHVRPNGNLIMSTTTASSAQEIGGKYFENGDIIEFNPHDHAVDALGAYQARKVWNEEAMFKNSENIAAITIDEYSSTLSHFLVQNSRTGLHCADNKVTVTAVNTADNVLVGYSGTIILFSAQGTEGSHLAEWSTTNGHNQVAMGTVYGALFGTYTFHPDDQGSVDFTFRQEIGSSSEGLWGHKVLPKVQELGDNTLNGIGQPMTLYPYSFTFTNEPLDPANPVMERAPMVSGTDNTMYLTAYGSEEPGANCAIIESYDGPNTLAALWYPGTEATYPVRPPITFENGGSSLAISSAVTFPEIEFDQGVATLDNFAFDEVGELHLLLLDWNEGLPLGITGSDSFLGTGALGMIGESVVFAPDHFEVGSSPIRNPSTGGAGGSTQNWFAYAGETFDVTVTAKNSKGNTTLNFGHEATPQTVELSYDMLSPLPFDDRHEPDLLTADPADGCGDCTEFVFANGVATGTVAWDAVGTIEIKADVNNAAAAIASGNTIGGYLDSGFVSQTVPVSDPLRFSPAAFEIADDYPTGVVPACGDPSDGFTYADQPFKLAFVKMRALRGDGSKAVNYHSANLSEDTWDPASIDYRINPVVEADAILEDAYLEVDSVQSSSGWGFGERVVQFGASIAEFYGPKTDVTLQLDESSFSEPDGAILVDHDIDPDTHFDFETTEIRNGRIRVVNAYGSELKDVRVPVQIEHKVDLGGGQEAWVVASDDACTQEALDPDPDTGTNVVGTYFKLKDIQPDSAASQHTPGIVDDPEVNPLPRFLGGRLVDTVGEPGAVLAAPGEENGGDVVVEFDTTMVPWLDEPDEVVDGKVTFGIHKHSQKQVFTREVY